VDRRALAILAAAGFVVATPALANAAASADALLAQSDTGTLTAQGLASGEDTGTLSKKPKSAGERANAAQSSDASSSGALPFTGSDPRITLLLGFAAVLAGAGLRLRTGDARDF
jgi:hypothetical protein